jgi:GT2 family glycosyltransferase
VKTAQRIHPPPELTVSSSPSVVVPTHAGGERLARLLESLRAQTVAHEVVVVDNGSFGETRELLAGRYPHVRVVSLGENVGFARAVNRGVEAARSQVIVLVNDDVVCEPDFLERLTARLAPEEGVVMAAGVLLSASREGTIDSAGIVFDRTLLAFDYLHGEPVSVLDPPVTDPLGPTGGAAAFDRGAFEAVGGFDEAFFAYLEDVDLTVRLVARGGRCRLAPDARAVHDHSASLGSGSRRKNELMGWGRGYMVAKYRLHRRPRLLLRALASEVMLSGGQLLVDRTASGMLGRIRGFRSGLRASGERLGPLPSEALAVSFPGALSQRMRRRNRMSARWANGTATSSSKRKWTIPALKR